MVPITPSHTSLKRNQVHLGYSLNIRLSLSPDERASVRASDRYPALISKLKIFINTAISWPRDALAAVLKTPWHVTGGMGVSASAAAGWGSSIDLARHVLPPEDVTVYSWCKGAL
jgi:hypothetical protein